MAGQVVVIGGGLVGVETAQHIAVHNQTVTIVEMQSELATDMEGGARHFMLESLKANDVASRTDSTVVEIRDNSVVIETGGERQEIPADQVIVAVGSKSNTQLLEEIGDRIPTIVLGDAMLVGKALEGINNAYAQALTI